MTDDFDDSLAQKWNTKLSDCPYAPSDPRWKRWQRLYMSYTHQDDQGVILPQLQRMQALKAAIPEPTEAQSKAQDVMAEIEDYNKWVEKGQPPEEDLPDWADGWYTDIDGVRRPANIKFFPVGSRDVTADVQAQTYIHLANLMHTTPDQIQAASDNIRNAFQTITTHVTDSLKTIADVFKAILDARRNLLTGRGWIPDYNFAPLLDVWDWFDDERPRIAALTWLQYDAI